MIVYPDVKIKPHPLGFFDKVEIHAHKHQIESLIQGLSEAIKGEGDNFYVTFFADKVVDEREERI